MAIMGCRDGVHTVSTAGVKIGQQTAQRAVGPLPHQAVDGGQFRRHVGW